MLSEFLDSCHQSYQNSTTKKYSQDNLTEDRKSDIQFIRRKYGVVNYQKYQHSKPFFHKQLYQYPKKFTNIRKTLNYSTAFNSEGLTTHSIEQSLQLKRSLHFPKNQSLNLRNTVYVSKQLPTYNFQSTETSIQVSPKKNKVKSCIRHQYIENYINQEKDNQSKIVKESQLGQIYRKLNGNRILIEQIKKISKTSKVKKNSQNVIKIVQNQIDLIQPINKYKQLDDYVLGKCLGQGRYGKVYQIVHKQTGAIFALKKVSKKLVKESEYEKYFLQEIKLQSYFNHRKILTVYDFFDDQGFFYLILQYMEGTLYSYLKKKKKMSEEDAAEKLLDVAQAIHALHQEKIAHRDIKPQNIGLNYGICKLCDFGLATICKQRRRTRCGTIDYSAPQILAGDEYDMSVDTWCLGVLAYELMVGQAPFYHQSMKQTQRRIINVENFKIQYPESLSKLAISFIQQLLVKTPELRMKSEQILQHPFLSKAKLKS